MSGQHLVAGQVVAGRYEIVRHLDSGGMGSVYEARHHLSRKQVALKVLHEVSYDAQSVERFQREVRAAADIGHPGIVEVYDAGPDEHGRLFIAMELLQGESLRHRIARVSRDEAIGLVDRMLEPLAAAHAAGFVHRDLKPENVFVSFDADGRERIKILDFGIARQMSQQGSTQTGASLGTPYYMAPEQAMTAKGASPAADVWSVGAILYEIVAGEPPFTGETSSAVIVKLCTEPHVKLDARVASVDAGLSALVDDCLAKDPARRPRDATQLRLALKRVRGDVGLMATALAPEVLGPDTGPMGEVPLLAPPPRAMPATEALPAAALPSPGGMLGPLGGAPRAGAARAHATPGAVVDPARAAPTPAFGGAAPPGTPGFGSPAAIAPPTPHATPAAIPPAASYGTPDFAAPPMVTARPAGGGSGMPLILGGVAVAALCLLCLVGGVIAVAVKSAGGGTATAPPPDVPADFVLQSGTNWNVRHPMHWQPMPPMLGTVLTVGDPMTPLPRTAATIVAEPFYGQTSQYADTYRLFVMGLGGQLVREDANVRIGSHPAVEMEIAIADPAGPMRGVRRMAAGNGTGFAVTCMGGAVRWDNGERAVCMRVIESFRVMGE